MYISNINLIYLINLLVINGFNERPIELVIWVDRDVPAEHLLVRLFDSDRFSVVDLINSDAFNSVYCDDLICICGDLTTRLDSLRDNFTFTFKERYIKRHPFGVQFGNKPVDEIPTSLGLFEQLQYVEYLIDLHYYYKYSEHIDRLQYEYDVSYAAKDIQLRSEYLIKLLLKTNLKINEDNNSYYDYNNYYYVFDTNTNKMVSLEDLGYVPLVKKKYVKRPRIECPLLKK